jgi:hypothetical protein
MKKNLHYMLDAWVGSGMTGKRKRAGIRDFYSHKKIHAMRAKQA